MDGQESSPDGKPKTVFAAYVEKHGLYATISDGLRECFVRRLEHPRLFLSEHFSNESLRNEHQLTKTEIENFGYKVRVLTERVLHLENDELKLKKAVFEFKKAIELLSNKWIGPEKTSEEVKDAHQVTPTTNNTGAASVETQESVGELKSPDYEEHVASDNMKTGSTLQTNDDKENLIQESKSSNGSSPLPGIYKHETFVIPTPPTKRPKRSTNNARSSDKIDSSVEMLRQSQLSARLKRNVSKRKGPGYYRSLSQIYERKSQKPRVE